MGRIILSIILGLFISSAIAGGIPKEQQQAGKWVFDEEFKTLVETQMKENLDEGEKAKCERKLEYYSKKLEKKPDSEYYQRKLEKYIKRCTK